MEADEGEHQALQILQEIMFTIENQWKQAQYDS